MILPGKKPGDDFANRREKINCAFAENSPARTKLFGRYPPK